MNQELFNSVDNYISSLFTKEDDILKQIADSNKESGLPEISISANQGKFLNLLAQLCQAKRILELGTLGAYSTIWMARALPENGQLISIELSEVYSEIAIKNINTAGLSNVVEIKRGKALDILSAMIAEQCEPFDMIFIDADKPPYARYLDLVLKLSRPGTLIIADNVIRDGMVLDENSNDDKVIGVRRFNKILAENDQLDATILQMVGVKEYDGMAIAIVKTET